MSSQRRSVKTQITTDRRSPAASGRWAGTTRATRFGRVKDYAKRCNDELCLLVQVETRQALDEIEKIAAVDGVDGIFIGPSDLAASLGHLGNSGHPDVQAAIADAIARIRACSKAAGILTPDEVRALYEYLTSLPGR